MAGSDGTWEVSKRTLIEDVWVDDVLRCRFRGAH